MNATEPRDEDFMHAALSLARRGLGNTAPNPAVGCILVNDGCVVGHGWTQPGGRPHAEAMALSQAGDGARGATAYVTLEPCAHQGETPPCADALVSAGVKRVVVAVTDPDPRVAGKGLEILQNSGIEVISGVLEADAWRANLGFFKRITERRPAFTLKLATDRDGLIPPPDAEGEDRWITSPEARRRAHLLRAQHDAVVFGIGTVLVDDPQYTCRLKGLENQSPIRVVLDSHLRLPDGCKLLQTLDAAPLWIVTADGIDEERARNLEVRGARIIRVEQDMGGRVNLAWLAEELAGRELNRVLIETGPKLTGAFLKSGLVDEIQWFRASKSLGAVGVPAIDDFDMEKLASTVQAVLQAGPDKLEIHRLGA